MAESQGSTVVLALSGRVGWTSVPVIYCKHLPFSSKCGEISIVQFVKMEAEPYGSLHSSGKPIQKIPACSVLIIHRNLYVQHFLVLLLG